MAFAACAVEDFTPVYDLVARPTELAPDAHLRQFFQHLGAVLVVPGSKQVWFLYNVCRRFAFEAFFLSCCLRLLMLRHLVVLGA